MESMTSSTLPVDIKIASPCSAKWDDMPGGDTVRSCAHCARKVYNLSEMPTAEAADLIRAAEGRLCVRFYRRADGTIMTKDCPTGLRAVRVRAARVIGVAFTSLLVWSGLNLSSRPRSEYPYLLRLLLNQSDARPVMGDVATPTAPIKVENADPGRGEHAMGKLALPMAPSLSPSALSPHIEVLVSEDVDSGEPGSGKTSQIDSRAPVFFDVPPTYSTYHTYAPSVSNVGKPFLRGLEVDNAPREDPFAPTNKSTKRDAK